MNNFLNFLCYTMERILCCRDRKYNKVGTHYYKYGKGYSLRSII